MTESGKTFTHMAYSYRRIGKKPGRFLETGVGRIDSDGKVHVHLDRTPLNGFSGYIQLTPHGTKPEVPPARPYRPGVDDADADDHGEG